jgi:hypothetical protein
VRGEESDSESAYLVRRSVLSLSFVEPNKRDEPDPRHAPGNGSCRRFIFQALSKLYVNYLVGGLAWISVKISATTNRTSRALHKWYRIVHRFALRRPFVDAWRTALLRADFDWLRNRAGGRPNPRLKARLKDGSDS